MTPVKTDSSSIDVSVLLTVYKRTEYLREALEGALAQTLASIEILVVDDSNSTEVKAIVDTFSDLRVRYRPNPTNLGVALSLRGALAECQGRYVAILNDDDAWEPLFLERLMAPLDEEPSRALAFCDFWVMDTAGTIDREKSERFSLEWGRTELPPGEVGDPGYYVLIKNAIPFAMGALFRKDALDPRELAPEIAGAYDFWICLVFAAEGKPMFFVKERLSRYRLHDAMESNRRAANKNLNFVYIYSELIRRGWFPGRRTYLRQRLVNSRQQMAQDLWSFGRPLAAFGWLLKCLGPLPVIWGNRLRRAILRR